MRARELITSAKGSAHCVVLIQIMGTVQQNYSPTLTIGNKSDL